MIILALVEQFSGTEPCPILEIFWIGDPQKFHEESAMQKSRWTYFSVFLKCVTDDEVYDVTCR